MTISIRPATEEDILALNGGRAPEYRVHAYSCFADDMLVACGGFAYLPHGGTLLFLNTVDNWQKRLPVLLVKTLDRVIEDALSRNRQHIYAYPQGDMGEVAVRFLERMNFKPHEGGFYKWHS